MKTLRNALFAAALLVAGFSLPAVAQEAAAGKTGAEALTTFNQLVEKSGVTASLNADETYTVFAPSDDAFAKLTAVLETISAEELKAILLNHIVAGSLESSALTAEQTVTTVGGAVLTVRSTENGVTINTGTNVIAADIKNGNLVIHAIDGVIIPQPEEEKTEAAPAPAEVKAEEAPAAAPVKAEEAKGKPAKKEKKKNTKTKQGN
jgi:uncharacterized surface protein with fasciclin (FAS1) repeats